MKDKSWIKTTIGSFIATVLGIALTLGISKIVDIKNSRAMQRQCVFNVLSDLENASRYIRKDSVTLDELASWLPELMERYSENSDFSMDSAIVHFCQTDYYPYYQKGKCAPVGRDIMSAIVPTNETDMAIHRTMELAYAYIDNIQKGSDQLFELVEYMRQIRVHMSYSNEECTIEEIVEQFTTDPKICSLTEMVWQYHGIDIYGSYLKNIKLYFDTILKMSGITEEEFREYQEDVDHLQGR